MSITGTEITRAEFDAISEKEGTFFANGCVFDEETENALALSDLLVDGTYRYYKLTREEG